MGKIHLRCKQCKLKKGDEDKSKGVVKSMKQEEKSKHVQSQKGSDEDKGIELRRIGQKYGPEEEKAQQNEQQEEQEEPQQG